MKEFKSAAVKAQSEESDEDYLEFNLAGQTFRTDVPTTAQMSLVIAAIGSENVPEMMSEVMLFFKTVLHDDGFDRLRELMRLGVVPMDLLVGGDEQNEEGILDWLMENVSDRPTQPPTGSSASPRAGGQRSTGRSPGAGSTRSPSRSPAS